ncbi:hypothetical protein [Haloprofundus halophilus]|uniref:hypothetical protein n=1 Tax=Haloprofundus halophilus TaxID=2283527 RepID=UPI0013002896|nr:hypothetical protein [Haloprofundus halophilus]
MRVPARQSSDETSKVGGRARIHLAEGQCRGPGRLGPRRVPHADAENRVSEVN